METAQRIRLPMSQLVTLSIYWLGHPDHLGRSQHHDPPGPSRRREPRHAGHAAGGDHGRGRRGADPDPADGRRDQRLHGQSMGPPQAVHRGRHPARCRVPRRPRVQLRLHRHGGLLLPAPGELEPRTGPVPGVCPGPRPRAPGGGGQRSDGSDADARDDRRRRDRHARRHRGQPRARHPGARRRGAGDDGRARRHRGRGPEPRPGARSAGPPSRDRRGDATSWASATSSGCSSCGCCSSAPTTPP